MTTATITAVACPECGNTDRLTPAEMRDNDGKLKRIRWTCNPCGHVWNDPPLSTPAERLLTFLQHNPSSRGYTYTELARAADVAQGSMTFAINKLLADGTIRRVDGRVHLLAWDQSPVPTPGPTLLPVATTRTEPTTPPAPAAAPVEAPAPAPAAPPAPLAITTAALVERLRADYAAVTERLEWHRREAARLEDAEAALGAALHYYEGEATA